jgi:hypothetical protein
MSHAAGKNKNAAATNHRLPDWLSQGKYTGVCAIAARPFAASILF